MHIPISNYYRPVLFFRRPIAHTHFKLLQACSIFQEAYCTYPFQITTGLFYFSGDLLHIPISDYYRPVLIFRRSITHTHFTLLQACSIFKQLMYLHSPDRTNRITITTTDTSFTNDKFCSSFCDALYRAILSAGSAFNAGIVYIKF